ncbi:hypothetical protein [Variovorax paradoxus]|uniref:Uncharacterized protein n=1 Tax=Variovorax paradoxus TaxID=34073 RepID=A0A679JIJ9_VARPD|nr:hypothetical protein VVAX_03582 [Variovorax paradoxus]
MSTISKRDAALLVASIRSAKVSGHAIAARTGGRDDAAMAGFLGGLESVLQHFLMQSGCFEAATALSAAMNDMPTDVEIARRNNEIAQLGMKARAA